MNTLIFHKKTVLTSLLVLVSALILWPQTASAEVILAHNYVYTTNASTTPPQTTTFTNLLYSDATGQGTYSSVINVGTEGLWVDSTKRVTDKIPVQIAITGNITAGNYRQVDSDYTYTDASGFPYDYSGGQNGKITFNGGMTANFSGAFTVGGHTTINFGTDANSTATVTTAGKTTWGSACTSNVNIRSGSTYTANGAFSLNSTGSQGHLYLNGTLNLNSSAANTILLGDKTNVLYTSTVNINNGGVLNALNGITHCGYDGQLFFKLNTGGTANLYGMTWSHNNDSGNGSSAGKTLQLLGGTLNLGNGGIAVGKNPAYPLLFKSGRISTLEGTTTSQISVDVGVGSGETVLAPKAGATLKFSGAIANATFADVGTGGTLNVNGAGTVEIAGSLSTTNGVKLTAGTLKLSGTVADATPITASAGTISFAGVDKTYANPISITGTTVLDAPSGASSTASNLTSTISLTKTGTGTLTLSTGGMTGTAGAAYTFLNVAGALKLTGTTSNAMTVTLKSTANDATGTGSITVGANSTLKLDDSGTTRTFRNPITLDGGTLVSVSNSSGAFCRMSGKLTLNQDSTVTTADRIEWKGAVSGEGKILTTNGNFFLDNASVKLKQVIAKGGTLGIQGSPETLANVTDGVRVDGGTFHIWNLKGVKGNVTFNGGGFNANGGNSSTDKSGTWTFLKNTNLQFDTYGTNVFTVTMNNKMVAASGITVTKNGTQKMILAGDMSQFHGTLNLANGALDFQNGGNTPETAYDFNFKFSNGTLNFTDSGTYYFTGNPFTGSTAATVNLGNSTLSFSGQSTLSATSADLTISGGKLMVEDGTLTLSEASGKSLTINSPITLSNATLSVGEGVTVSAPNLVLKITGTQSDWSFGENTLENLSLKNGDTLAIRTDLTTPLDFAGLLTGTEMLSSTTQKFDGMTFNLDYDPTLFGTAGLVAVGQGNSLMLYHNSAVPEPATWLLLLVGFGVLALARRTSPRTN